jgi:hypothetical protein
MGFRFGAALAALGLLVAAPCGMADPIRGVTLTAGVVTAQHNMTEADKAAGVRALLAPGTKVPAIGPTATELEYARWAKSSLERGQAAEAELSLEWGQVRRRVDEEEDALEAHKPPPPYDSKCDRMLCKAMLSIGKGNNSEGMTYIKTAIDDMEKRGQK